MKKFLKTGSLSILFVFMFSSFVHAESGGSGVIIEEGTHNSFEQQVNMNVLTTIPGETTSGEMTTFGVTQPSTLWNLNTKGRYNFSGSAGSSTLYSNYVLTGKSQVKIYIKNNNSSNALKASLKETGFFGSTVWNYSISPGGSVTAYVPTSSATKYYLQFNAPSNFSGYIE